ncbi:Bifunctional inhibitor/plant lipid transfer protein/seed storage helical domain containing protein [Quillaja saponaria]|uniref:Bifunctional inhibitor/plant lipid transfer protein/seed storage helical domain containing protein n=1 Tax=Quillaja saponaria TaxID=32244 RepID=A0AAD7Q129_QUISA|nr:Bifunctional inhibitor/plant lipid transfer protein/seed storage helical domain containing protein [Quillaja saponaria]KAJ7972823.1 Bifunctional inhibitor/plant lipid transfer protein/seed storage helical domain containing protein [Quillaja saponaria]
MERFKILNLITLSVAFVAFVPNIESLFGPPMPPIAPRPLCASQIALANYACAMIPYTPVPPPSPPSNSPTPPPPEDSEGNRHHHEHGHGHGHGHAHSHSHRHRHRAPPSPVEDNCCRWAREVDNQCVCEILVHLPSFLSRPIHSYILSVGGFCNVTYTCAGAILRG